MAVAGGARHWEAPRAPWALSCCPDVPGISTPRTRVHTQCPVPPGPAQRSPPLPAPHLSPPFPLPPHQPCEIVLQSGRSLFPPSPVYCPPPPPAPECVTVGMEMGRDGWTEDAESCDPQNVKVPELFLPSRDPFKCHSCLCRGLCRDTWLGPIC